MFLKCVLMLCIILSYSIVFADNFDFSNLYLIKDATGSGGKVGKYLYYNENGGKRFGYTVDCDDSTSQYESAVLKSITGLASPIIKVPVKNRVLIDNFDRVHLGSKYSSLLRLCPSSPSNEIEFYKYANSYYLRFANNFGSESFSEIFFKVNSVLLVKTLLAKKSILVSDYYEIEQDPELNGNAIFEIKTVNDDALDPSVFDLSQVTSESYEAFTSNVFSPDSKYIITYDNYRNFNATIWLIATGKAMVTLAGHTDDITSVLYSPNGQAVITASRDGTARVWNPTTGKTLGILKHEDTVFSASYSPHGDYIVTGSGDHTAKVWDANTFALLNTLRGHSGRIVSAVYDPTGQYVLTFTDWGDRTVKIWN